MITNKYLQMMARYNRWQNREIFAAVDLMPDAERREDRGLFWGSIHGTLSHIYWADRIWLSRFDLVDPPGILNPQSPQFVEDWAELKDRRVSLDDLMVEWSDGYKDGLIKGTLKFFSGSLNKDVEAPLSVVLPHIFNHQTHHRGQVHALLTAAGGKTADTDLFLMPEELWR